MTKLLFNMLGGKPDVEEEEAPGTDVQVLEKDKEDEESPWRVILYNDEIHTFAEVIGQLIKALACEKHQAEKIAKKVDSKGKATVFEGTFEECFEINGVLKEIQLVTEIKG